MTSSLAPTRWSRLGAAAFVVAVLLLGPLARPVVAASADPQLTVSVSQRWPLGSTPGTWTPYVVTIANTGTASFTGEVELIPVDAGTIAPNTYPVYTAPVTVNRGTQRTVPFDVVDAPSGYRADVRDPSGRLVGHGTLSSTSHADSAIGVLSDLTQADQKIAAPLRLTQVNSSVARFTSAQEFPTSAVYLSGLNGLIVDQFDSAALSQAQIQALKDYVGLGGTLIEAGGPSWRRTLLSLPPELLPMRPTTTSTASLSELAALILRTTDQTAQVASGPVASGRATLAADDGQPLVVEGTYGAGLIEELAFDPFAEPFTTQVELAAAAWGHAISRALSGVQGASRPTATAGFGQTTSNVAVAAPPGGWAPGYGTNSDQISSILTDAPAAGAPPVGLLGGLLVAYVLLAGLLNYLFLKAAGRRQLMWLSVPAIALVFTIGAYGVGFGTRGSDFLVTEAQVQRLAPEGAVETYSFDGVYPPRKGDVTLSLPANTLASTAVAGSGLGSSEGQAIISGGAHPQVLLANVAVWNMRMLQTLAVGHPYTYEPRAATSLQAQVRIQKGHLVGRIANLGSRPVEDLEVIGASGAPQTVVSSSLAPGASVAVNVDLTPVQSSAPAPASDGGVPLPGISESTRASMVHLAASQVLGGTSGPLALVGFTLPGGSFSVDGVQPGRSAVAAVVEPVVPQSADALSTLPPRPRLVSNYTNPDGISQTDVYDFDLPVGLAAAPVLSYQLQDGGQSNVRSVEVYDWGQHTWRSLPRQTVARSQPPSALAAGELAQGVVRVRVVEGFATNAANLALGDQPQP